MQRDSGKFKNVTGDLHYFAFVSALDIEGSHINDASKRGTKAMKIMKSLAVLAMTSSLLLAGFNTASAQQTYQSASNTATQSDKEQQIADLKNRINDLESQAQHDEELAIEGEVEANAGGGFAILNSLAQTMAQSARNDAAKERAEAAILRQKLIALQGDSDGAEAQGMSGFGMFETAVKAIEQGAANSK
jgi:cell division protein FtsB